MTFKSKTKADSRPVAKLSALDELSTIRILDAHKRFGAGVSTDEDKRILKQAKRDGIDVSTLRDPRAKTPPEGGKRKSSQHQHGKGRNGNKSSRTEEARPFTVLSERLNGNGNKSKDESYAVQEEVTEELMVVQEPVEEPVADLPVGENILLFDDTEVNQQEPELEAENTEKGILPGGETLTLLFADDRTETISVVNVTQEQTLQPPVTEGQATEAQPISEESTSPRERIRNSRRVDRPIGSRVEGWRSHLQTLNGRIDAGIANRQELTEANKLRRRIEEANHEGQSPFTDFLVNGRPVGVPIKTIIADPPEGVRPRFEIITFTQEQPTGITEAMRQNFIYAPEPSEATFEALDLARADIVGPRHAERR